MDVNDGLAHAPKSEKLRAVHAAWEELRAGRIGPKRDEITPARLRGVLPWTFTIDVVDGGKDFRFRFAGDRIIQYMGRRYAGSLLSELSGSAFFDNASRIFKQCIATKAPVKRGPVKASLSGREFLEVETIVLPLSEDGQEVSTLFGAFDSWQLGTHTSTG